MGMKRDGIGTMLGAEVRSVDQHRVGEVEQVFIDDESGAPKWVSVHAGVFGAVKSMVPVQNAQLDDGVLRVPFTKQVIADAPRVTDQGHLSPEEEEALRRHYRSTVLEGRPETTGGTHSETSDGDVSPAGSGTTMILSEEQLHVAKQTVETGRLRLRKRIVTETRTVEVTVSREELVVDDDNVFADTSTDTSVMGGDGAALSEDEFEIVLHEESVLVEKRVVPFERVRVRKHIVHDTTTVSEQLQKEKIDTDRDDSGESRSN